MAPQTVTHAAETETEPRKLFELLTRVEEIPRWAPVFADTVERIGDDRCRVTKDGQSFEIEVSAQSSAGTVDYVREMARGRRGGAYIRVTPRPLGGSSISMTVPIGANTTEADVRGVLVAELAELIRLAQF